MHKNNITNLLNLQGVIVKNQKFNKNSIELWIECKRNVQICPCCHSKTSRIHDYYPRTFNHINIGKKSSTIHYLQRRYVCTSCSKRFPEKSNFITRFYGYSNDVVNSVFQKHYY